jgi:transketolase
VREHFAANLGARGRALRDEWTDRLDAYGAEYPELADQLRRMQRRELPDGWDRDIPEFPPDEKGMAGREASGKVLNAIAANHPWVLGGAADLAPSTKTRLTIDGAGDFSRDDRHGRNLHFGVREHAMGAAVNGLSLSKLRPFGSGFLIFSDYGRAPIRLGALMEIPTIHVFTHDSIGVGEDGPTHQPIEQLASLRAMPALITLRPGDANEVAEAWRLIMELRHDPAVLVLSRQAMRTLDRSVYAPVEGVRRGAYVLADPPAGDPEVIIMASGTEVALAVGAFELLSADGVRARVVSMPSWNLFEREDEAYREQVLPRAITARVGVEQASDFGWDRYVGPSGTMIAMRSFGMSAPLKDLQRRFGFTPEAVAEAARAQLGGG